MGIRYGMAEDKEQYYKILKLSYDVQEQYLREMRALKHDMQAHMIVLQYYLDAEKYKEAKAYIQEIRAHQELLPIVQAETGNRMVDTIITERCKQSLTDIKVFCEGKLPQQLGISEYDLCTIFSNLFSNALEACEKLEQKAKEIRIKIEKEAAHWSLEMQNPLEWEVDIELLGKNTAKEDKVNHGFGIQNVMQAVKRNGGDLRFLVENEIFFVKIIF